MRRSWTLLGLVVLAVAGVIPALGGGALAQTVTPTASATAATPTPTTVPAVTPPAVAPYFSLGDSIADAEGASSRELGYVPLFAAKAWPLLGFPGSPADRGDYGLRGGETSTSMLAPGGQLDRATAEITRRNTDSNPANDVRLITVDIGGNDFRALTRSTSPCVTNVLSPDCQAAVAEVTTTFNANFPVILHRIRAAAGPKTTIIAMAFYNPFSGTGQVVDAPGDIVVAQIAAQAKSAATAAPVSAIWVDLVPLFQGKAPQLTHIADGNIHPTDQGHAVIAEAVYQALQAATTPPAPPAVGTGPTPAGEHIPVVWVLGVALMGAGMAIGIATRTRA